jgi:hypothetical protein
MAYLFAVDFLMSKGIEKKDIDMWFKKHIAEKHIPLFEDCIFENVFTDIAEWSVFCKNLHTLSDNPYLKDSFGEEPRKMLAIRDKLVCSLKNKSLLKDETDVLFAKRYNFATWILWLINKNKLYLPLKTICIYAHQYDLDVEEMFKYMRKHPTHTSMYTYVQLNEYEIAIKNLFTKSSSFNIAHTNDDFLDSTQNKTVQNILQRPFSILQGGAGVGKTTTMSGLIKSLLQIQLVDIYCLAFTHKAKNCLNEKIAIQNPSLIISTIHSFILGQSKTTSFNKPLFVLIDEASMVDLELMGQLAQLLISKAINGFQLLFVGDDMQLPPIGRGEIFRFLIEKHFNVNNLTKCYRVDKPDLFKAYQMIRSGAMPKSSENVHIISCSDDKAINTEVGKLISKGKGFNPNTTQIIAWQNRDVFKINKWVQQNLLRKQLIGPNTLQGFYEKDKVVFCGENNDTCTNAMQGIVKQITNKTIIIEWNNNKQSVYQGELRDVQLSYCMTCHKLQGSECENIIVPCYEVEKMMAVLDRRWFYTAVTRAKQSVTLVTTPTIEEFLLNSIKSLPITAIDIKDIS